MRLVIDCNSLAYRNVYNMTELSFGEIRTNVIYGFLKGLLDLAEMFKTNKFVFCWDSRQSYRKMIDETYKAGRVDEKQEKLVKYAREQFFILRTKILPKMGFKNVFMQSGYESDDLIAWVVWRFPEDQVIVTGDNDLMQLLHDDRFCPIKIFYIPTKKIITEKNFTNKYGIKPSEWSHVKAIGGCQSDNVKGIPGVGQESAIKFLNGVLKDGAIKNRILSDEGKRIAKDCLWLVSLPFCGDRQIDITEIFDDELFSMNFMDVFKEYGCHSFLRENFERWRKAFKLIAGRQSEKSLSEDLYGYNIIR